MDNLNKLYGKKKSSYIGVDYKVKCGKCKKYVRKKNIMSTYTGKLCKDCLSVRRLKRGTIKIPKTFLNNYKIKVDDEVKLVEIVDGILIKKVIKNEK